MQKILIIDDSLLIRKRLKKMIGEDYELFEAENGLKGLDQLKKNKPDCVLTDLLMPEMDGFKLLEITQRHQVGIPIIVLTADIQNETRQRCMDLGAYSVLNKPPKEEELTHTITEALTKFTQA